MSTAFLGLGSNLGERERNLTRALELLLGRGVEIVAVSSFYETEPQGFKEQPPFLNAVCQVETALAPEALLALAKGVEQEIGRWDSFRNAPRIIDLDLLLYEDVVLATAEVEVPHPRMVGRSFVLVPFAEIAPGVEHPLLGKTVAELAREAEEVGVRRWCPPPDLAVLRPGTGHAGRPTLGGAR